MSRCRAGSSLGSSPPCLRNPITFSPASMLGGRIGTSGTDVGFEAGGVCLAVLAGLLFDA